ncbi:MAG: carbohydrate kinase [Planctomycetota bacterium]|nr:carbohydrate kinase [Planctomycetota bacterium]
MSDSDTSLDLVSLGDLMIDFICVGADDSGMLRFERNPGGAPMNAAAQLSRLGGKAAAIACVGADEHGDFLRDAMHNLGVDTANVRSCAGQGTRILFVYFRDGGERYFTDYRGPRADLEIPPDEIDFSVIGRARALLASPLCNTYDRPIFETARRALAEAERYGVPLAFDANYRFPYMDDRLRRLDLETILRARILKMTSEEFAYYLDEADVMRGSERLLEGNARVVAVSMGRDGSFVRTRNGHAYRPAYAVDAVDTTGAGDSFMGALLYCLTRTGVDMDALGADELGRIAEFANACAAVSTTRRGALLAMPDREEAERIMAAVPCAPSVM